MNDDGINVSYQKSISNSLVRILFNEISRQKQAELFRYRKKLLGTTEKTMGSVE